MWGLGKSSRQIYQFLLCPAIGRPTVTYIAKHWWPFQTLYSGVSNLETFVVGRELRLNKSIDFLSSGRKDYNFIQSFCEWPTQSVSLNEESASNGLYHRKTSTLSSSFCTFTLKKPWHLSFYFTFLLITECVSRRLFS